ncbi:unnamed protein product [Lupinus luteus]|uniref:Uncharacterized protein n=1 Tax=Lupinus luteus TaxID=3873 RepID=A0AAV1XKA6_LUPLU
MCDDDWVKLAMADDSKVVDLLLNLHHPRPPPPLLHLHWTLRQRRSKSVPRNKADPTTPLSWSGATSASGGAVDGDEDSCHPTTKHAQTSRSKIANPNETTTTKKSRRKKTLAELKEEEGLLSKEQRSLKNELASLRVTAEKHRATNERLKRMKLEFESRQNSKSATTTFEVSGKAVLDPSKFQEAQCYPSSSLSSNNGTHKVLGDDSPVSVSAANASYKPQQVVNRVVSVYDALKEKKGEMQTSGSHEVLDKALGLPEYSGCNQGVGVVVSKRKYLPPQKTTMRDKLSSSWILSCNGSINLKVQ